MEGKIKSFSNLKAWQEARILASMIYKATKNFPKEELFSLTNQMRRAVVSIVSNIAEGFSRQSLKEKIHFYYLALSSNTELQAQLVISMDLDYIKKKEFDEIASQSILVGKLLNGLIRKLKAKNPQLPTTKY